MANALRDLLDELEERIERLRIQYEKYFIGIEALEPHKEKAELAKIVRRLQTGATGNTAVKFRTQSIISRFVTYNHYWTRIQRKIEDGTHIRELVKLDKRLKQQGIVVKGVLKARRQGELEAAIAAQLQVAPDQGKDPAPEPRTPGTPPPLPAATRTPPSLPAIPRLPPPLPAAARTPPSLPAVAPAQRPKGVMPPPLPPAVAPAGAADTRFRSLFAAYVEARRQTGEPTTGVTYDRVMRSIQKQVSQLQQTTGCQTVDFKVEIKNGKAVLKAIPRH
jgi:hypothetical protein